MHLRASHATIYYGVCSTRENDNEYTCRQGCVTQSYIGRLYVGLHTCKLMTFNMLSKLMDSLEEERFRGGKNNKSSNFQGISSDVTWNY